MKYKYYCSSCGKSRPGLLRTKTTAWKCPACGGAPRHMEIGIPQEPVVTVAEKFFKSLNYRNNAERFVKEGEIPAHDDFEKSYLLRRVIDISGPECDFQLFFIVSLDVRAVPHLASAPEEKETDNGKED